MDIIFQVLGLDACADTLVGDQLLRSISGGQKNHAIIKQRNRNNAKNESNSQINLEPFWRIIVVI